MLRDLKPGFRLSVRYWGSSVAVVVIIGLALGAAAAVFCFARTVLAPQLPYAEKHRLVAIHETTPRSSRAGFRAALFTELQGLASLESVSALRYGGGGTLLGGSEPERVLGVFVSPSFFPTLGVEPLIGRLLTEDEAPHSAVISHSLWARRFGSNPSILGNPLELSMGIENSTLPGGLQQAWLKVSALLPC